MLCAKPTIVHIIAMLNAAIIGALTGFAITGLGLALWHWRKIRRDRAHLYDIPNFLSGEPSAGVSDGQNFVEAPPLPNSIHERRSITVCTYNPQDPINGTRFRVKK